MTKGAMTKQLSALIFIAAVMMGGSAIAASAEQFFSMQILNQAELLSGKAPEEGNTLSIRTNLNGLPKRKEGERKLFEQAIGDEKVLMHLPDKPVYTRVNDSWGATIALDKKVEYWLMAPIPAMGGMKPEILFPIFLEMYSSKLYRMKEYNITEQDGMPVLEITSLNRKTRKVEAVRVMISDANFYVATIKYPRRQRHKVDASQFLESVYVLK